MEAVSTSETSVNFYQTTWRNIPEDSHVHTRRRENLKFKLCNILGDVYKILLFLWLLVYLMTLSSSDYTVSQDD
jgi:hypothetical protein